MASVTAEVQEAIRTIPIGAMFTARDIAELLDVQSGAVGQIIAKGVRGAEPIDPMEARYDYPHHRVSDYRRKVNVYRRVPFNE